MLEDIKRHVFHYLILFGVLILGLWGFWFFSYNLLLKQTIILVTIALYLAWGVVHHYLEGNLNFKIVVEYTLVTVLATIVTLLITGASA